MAQQLINVGTVANDRTGDTWRDAFIKVNANETELFAFKDSQTFVFVAQESDFPTQDATTITLETNCVYVVGDSFSTGKRFVVESGSSFTAFNPFGPVVTYTGTSDMFTGVNASFKIWDVTLAGASSSEIFNFSETSTGGTKIFVADTLTINGAATFGTFDKMGAVQARDVSNLESISGFTITGNVTVVFSLSRISLISTSASFVGVDLGTAIIGNVVAGSIELDDLIFFAPAGAIGITGAASSANVPSGTIATVDKSNFTGGITPLQNITNDDIRWSFKQNSPIPDTIEDGMLSLNSNATETVISVSSTPVLVAGTWVVERASLFTGTTGGRLTYNGERDIALPIDVTATVSAASGTNKDIKIYIAINGTVVTNSGKANKVGSGDPKSTTVLWQADLSENDYVEVFMENNSDTVNLIAEDVILRIN